MERSRIVLSGFLVLSLAACASSPDRVAQQGARELPQVEASDEYRIGVDDEVQVSVWRNEDLSVTVPVRPDGMISVPLIGDVKAGGRTPTEVAAAVEQQLEQYLREPQATVIVTQLRSHEYLNRVRATGAVQSPVTLPYRQGMTVLDVVLEAGGLTDFAAPDRVNLYRRTKDGTEVLPVALGRILNDGDLSTNYYLMPGDVITVPERLF